MPLLIRFVLLGIVFSTSVSASSWSISTFAGTGEAGHRGDGGPAVAAQVDEPFGVVRGPDGAIWFCEYTGNRVRRVDPDGTISTIVGTGESGYNGDGGPAIDATLNRPHEIRFDAAGHLIIADTGNHVIRRVNARTGVINTIAGTGAKGYSGDGGPATRATFNGPHSIQLGRGGEIYICDVSNHVIRLLDSDTGLVTTFAGTGSPGPTPDGAPIRGTPLNNPRSLDVDREGNLWLVTRQGNQVLKFDLAAGVIRHIAGTGATGFTGNGGPARLATLSGPKGIAIDAAGNAWLADTESHSLRMFDVTTGNIELIAGTGVAGDGADGDALACALNRPHGVFVDTDGSVFVGDSEAHRVRVLHRSD